MQFHKKFKQCVKDNLDVSNELTSLMMEVVILVGIDASLVGISVAYETTSSHEFVSANK
jgi:hypothetical protein